MSIRNVLLTPQRETSKPGRESKCRPCAVRQMDQTGVGEVDLTITKLAKNSLDLRGGAEALHAQPGKGSSRVDGLAARWSCERQRPDVPVP
jgi:hypothetical protein